MIALLLACATAPTLTVTCTDSAGAEVFRAECPADADSCRALPEVEGG